MPNPSRLPRRLATGRALLRANLPRRYWAADVRGKCGPRAAGRRAGTDADEAAGVGALR